MGRGARRSSENEIFEIRDLEREIDFGVTRPDRPDAQVPTAALLLPMLSLLLCQFSLAALKLPRGYAQGLIANKADHAAELATSHELGFRLAQSAVPAVRWATSYKINRTSLGMGNECPFATDELVFASEPIFSPEECLTVRQEAQELISGGAQSTFTMTDTNRDVAVHDMPDTLAWLNGGAFARVTSLAAQCFPSAVDDAGSLWVYRGLVINYESAAGLTHQPIHRDGALVSCVVPLSERCEYEGGGTYVEPLGRGA